MSLVAVIAPSTKPEIASVASTPTPVVPLIAARTVSEIDPSSNRRYLADALDDSHQSALGNRYRTLTNVARGLQRPP